MSYYQIWRYWLLVVSIFIIVFGAIMALLNTTIVFAFFNAQINPVFWGPNPVPLPVQAFQAWAYGAWGATVMGWGITMLFIAWFPFGRRERWAWILRQRLLPRISPVQPPRGRLLRSPAAQRGPCHNSSACTSFRCRRGTGRSVQLSCEPPCQ